MATQPAQSPPNLLPDAAHGFAEGTMILARSGLLPVEDITAGEEVFTHRRRWESVTATARRTVPTVRIYCATLADGMLTAADQRFLTRSSRVLLEGGGAHGMSTAGWIRARDLTEGHRMASPLDFAEQLPVPDLPSRLAGMDLGDALHTAGSMIGLKGKTGAALCPDLVGWLEEHFGTYGAGRRFPAWAVTMPRELRQAFLEGLVGPSGDRGKFAVAMHSKRFMTGLRLLVCSLGPAAGIGAPGKSGKAAWRLSWMSAGGRRLDHDGFRWHSVSRVEHGPVAALFDLQVPGGSFIAEGLVAAATDPLER